MRTVDEATYEQIAYQIGCTASGIRRAMIRSSPDIVADETTAGGVLGGLRRAWRRVATLGLRS